MGAASARLGSTKIDMNKKLRDKLERLKYSLEHPSEEETINEELREIERSNCIHVEGKSQPYMSLAYMDLISKKHNKTTRFITYVCENCGYFSCPQYVGKFDSWADRVNN